MKSVEIKYRDGRQKVQSLRATDCYGVLPAGSSTIYWVFTLKNGERKQVAKSRLLPGYDAKASLLYGRPWLSKIKNADRIVLSEYRDWESNIGGYPADSNTIWRINYDDHTWVIIAGSGKKSRAILHIMNNPEITRRGDYKTALKKLFPGKKISVLQETITSIDIA